MADETTTQEQNKVQAVVTAILVRVFAALLTSLAAWGATRPIVASILPSGSDWIVPTAAGVASFVGGIAALWVCKGLAWLRDALNMRK